MSSYLMSILLLFLIDCLGCSEGFLDVSITSAEL
jgi:hypothetical protein